MFCVECGREGKLYEHVCADCFLEKHQLVTVPPIIDVVFCTHCESVQKGKHWESYMRRDEALMDAVESHVKLEEGARLSDLEYDINETDPNNLQLTLRLAIAYEDLLAQRTLETHVRLHNSSCDICSRRHGNYFAAIVQFRADNRDLDSEELQDVEELADRKVREMEGSSRAIFMTKKTRTHGGWDFYLSTHDAGKRLAATLAERHGGKVSDSAKLAGRKDGKDQFRMTYSVRIPEYRKGDFIEVGGRLLLVKSIRYNKADTIDLRTWQPTPMTTRELEGARMLGGPDMERSAVLILESELEVQLMDPDTYETVTLKKPAGFRKVGDTVPVVKTESGIFLLPR